MKTNKTILIILLVVIIVIGVFFYSKAHTKTSSISQCMPVVQTADAKPLIDSLDQQSYTFASSTKDIMGESTEGGSQVSYQNSAGEREVVEQRFYGETGQSRMRFYFKGQDIFAIVKLDQEYKVPLSVDNSGSVGTSSERDFYLSKDGKVCEWMLNGEKQDMTNDTQEMVSSFVSGIQ